MVSGEINMVYGKLGRFLFFFLRWGSHQVSLTSLKVDKAGLEITKLYLSLPLPELGLKAYATTPSKNFLFLRELEWEGDLQARPY